MDNARLWKVYFVFVLVVAVVTFIMFKAFGSVDVGIQSVFTTLVVAKISVAMGFLLSLLITLMVYSARKSRKFWDKAEIVEKLIDSCNTKSEMQSMYSADFADLRTLAMGQPHSSELYRLDAIIRTKYKYIQ